MITPKVIKNIHPHHINKCSLYFSKGNTLYCSDVSQLQDKQKLASYDAGSVKNLGARIDLIKRAGRLGFHDMQPYNEGLLAIQHKAIVYKPKGGDKFIKVFSDFRGSRPLNMLVHPETKSVYFGEYFGNAEREEVRIYSSKDLQNWELAWTFNKGVIRHVHGLVWDNFRKGMWVLTGDSNDESGLWFTGDNFSTLELIVSGSQKARAVEIIPMENGLIVPMDSPLEQNYINYYSLEEGHFKSLVELPGSAFHATYSNDLFLVSTVTEPSAVNNVDYVSIWASLDGLQWKVLSQLKKDWIPVKYQFISRYAEVTFPSGENTSDYIIAYSRALKGSSNSMLLWSKEEVISYLKQK